MMLSAFRADVALRAGDLAQAEQLSRAAWDAGRREEWELGHPAITAGLVDALRERGALAEAQEVLRVSGFAHPAELGHDLYTAAMLLYSRGRLLLALGATAAGVADLRDAGRRLDLHLEPNPALVPWRSALAVAVGGREGAALARDELRIARTFGAPRAIGIALRATAMLEGGTARAARLREAAEVLRRSPARLEHARVLADLGDALLQDGRRADARDVLREAYELAHVCGADALTTQAASALRTAGARPRRPFRQGPGSLTARERRVADLAADGLTNRGIADALVVTVSTVEFHLASTYRKLGIASRRELAGVLRGGSEGMGDGPDRVAAHATDR
jgi:DNA-binding CsgD family transcriptional regulator